MNLNLPIFCVAISLYASTPAAARSQYPVPTCGKSKREKIVGDRLKLPLPRGAVVKRITDADYSAYSIGFGAKQDRAWLSGVHGPLVSGEKAPEAWLSSSAEVSQRVWRHRKYEGIDARGKLTNGNYWRYFGQYGEVIQYYDVSAEAAAYFDSLIDKVCIAER